MKTGLSRGGWLELYDLDRTRLRLAVGLERKPSAVERHLLQVFVARVEAPERERVAEPGEGEKRVDLPARRAVFLIDLALFEDVRVAAGQLVAEQAVDDAERRLNKLLRSEDCVTRIGDDKFGVAALVPNEQSLDIVRERIATVLEDIPVPHRALRISPRIVGAFGNEIRRVPELVELDDKLSPYARAWVAVS
jgi:GGDEF domain-containing protein